MPRKYLIPSLLVLATALVYANSLQNGFVNYDDWWLVHHPSLAQWLTVDGLKSTFFDFSLEVRQAHGAEYLPIRDLSAALQYSLFGDAPWPYHAVQITLFCASVALFYSLLLSLNVSVPVAAGAALLFSVHPIHAEPVNWLAAHKDLLSFFFLLLMFVAYARNRVVIAMLALILAIGSKYPALVAPLLLPWIDRVQERRFSAKRLLPFLAISAFAWLIASRVGASVTYSHVEWGGDLFAVARNMLSVVDGSLMHLIAPLQLQLPYPWAFPASWLDLRVWRGLAVVVFLLLLLYYGWKKDSRVGLAAAIFLIGLAPMLKVHRHNLLADRYLLLPSMGFCLLLSMALFQSKSQKILLAGLCCLVWTGTGLTVHQNYVWESSVTLWEHAVRGEQPVHPVLWERLAVSLRDQWEWEKASQAYQEALRRNDYPPAERAKHLTNLGFVELQLGRYCEAEKWLRESLALNPNSPVTHLNLALVLWNKGKKSQARKEFRRAIQLEPNSARWARYAWKFSAGER